LTIFLARVQKPTIFLLLVQNNATTIVLSDPTYYYINVSKFERLDKLNMTFCRVATARAQHRNSCYQLPSVILTMPLDSAHSISHKTEMLRRERIFGIDFFVHLLENLPYFYFRSTGKRMPHHIAY